MSAIGFFCTPNSIICVSDGISRNHYTDEKSYDTRKVFLVNDGVAVMSVGYGVHAMPNLIDVAIHFEINKPADVADYLAQTLVRMEKLGPLPGQTLFLILGYDEKEKPRLFQVFTGSGSPYTPEEFPIQPGSGDAIAHTLNAEKTSFKGILSQKLQNGIDPEGATLAAFTEMVRDYESEGILVGGEIFQEIITPQHVPEMSMDEINAILYK